MGERTRGKGRTGPVTAEAVVDAALVVIDEDGLDALTMRRLAHDLGGRGIWNDRADQVAGGVADAYRVHVRELQGREDHRDLA